MMRMFSLFYAFRTLFSRSGDGVFSHVRGAIIGAAISIIPLVVVLEIADGMVQGIVNRYIEISSFHLQGSLISSDAVKCEDEIIEKISAIDGVKLVFPYTQGGGILYSENGRTGITVRGIPPTLYNKDEGFKHYITIKEGEFSLFDADSIIISTETAARLKAKVGDTIKLLTAKVFPGRPVVLKPTRLTVKGIYTSGYQELDMLSAFISQEYGEKLFKEDGSHILGIKVSEPHDTSIYAIAEEISCLDDGLYISTWEALNDSLVASLDTSRKFLLFIMILILGVASINISSSMIMMVISKRQDIAILKSTGASDADIAAIFILIGLFIGVCSSVLGIAFGIVVVLNINEIIDFISKAINYNLFESEFYLERIPVQLSFYKLSACAALSVMFAVIASWIPARRAGRINPVEIFRKH